MRTKLLIIFVALLTFTVIFFRATPKTNTRANIRVDYCVDTVGCEPIILPSNFEKVYKTFKSYNPYVDSSSAIKFAEVVEHFNLDSDPETLKWSLGQILLESGAKQYYQPTHPKEGQLVVSSAGAIGFTQILPSTALGYMQKKVTSEEVDCFMDLGATDFTFAYEDDCSKKEQKEMARLWLENETNNMIMWGKIMSSKLSKQSLMHALIAYNAGGLGLRRFLNLGKKQEEHKYILGIKTRLKYVNS